MICLCPCTWSALFILVGFVMPSILMLNIFGYLCCTRKSCPLYEECLILRPIFCPCWPLPEIKIITNSMFAVRIVCDLSKAGKLTNELEFEIVVCRELGVEVVPAIGLAPRSPSRVAVLANSSCPSRVFYFFCDCIVARMPSYHTFFVVFSQSLSSFSFITLYSCT